MSNPGISIPLIGGMPPIILDMSLDIMEEEELENEDDELLIILDMFEDMLEDSMFMFPMLDIIFPIISSIPRDGMTPIPPMDGMPPIDIMPPGIGPPEDIIVEDEDEEEEEELEIVDPSSD